jgi:hypothetical protein
VGNKVVARLTKEHSVILPKSNLGQIPIELNDELLGQIYMRGRKHRRIDGFDFLTNPADRLAELKTGRYEDFRAVAELFNFNVEEEDFAAIDRAKGLKVRVQEFFSTLQKEEEDRIRTAEEKARLERIAKEAVTWDTGEGAQINGSVTGSGGGQRLRVKKSNPKMVETSTGYSLTVVQAKKSWEFASKYWHGEKVLPSYGASIAITRSNGWRGSRRDAEIRNGNLHFGCQKVTRAEAERFADVMGWARAKKVEKK